jgi:hypothetical protein
MDDVVRGDYAAAVGHGSADFAERFGPEGELLGDHVTTLIGGDPTEYLVDAVDSDEASGGDVVTLGVTLTDGGLAEQAARRGGRRERRRRGLRVSRRAAWHIRGVRAPTRAPAHPRETFRARVCGDPTGAPEWVREIARVGTGPGWFEPDGVVWRVHGGLSTLVGGVAALLGQGTHPLALAGVQRHSAYREDPWTRLAGTARWLVVRTFCPRRPAGRGHRPGRTVGAGQAVAGAAAV